MATQELFAQAARLPAEERRFLAETIWETVDADLPAQWENACLEIAADPLRWRVIEGRVRRWQGPKGDG